MRKIFVLFIISLLVMPLLILLGAKESLIFTQHVKPHYPSFTVNSYFNREFQQPFEKWWNINLYYPTVLFRTKNQIYAALNFNRFYSKSYTMHKNGFLSDNAFLPIFDKDFCAGSIDKRMAELNFIAKELKKRNIKFMYILPPNKTDIYMDSLPLAYSYFNRYKTKCDVSALFAAAAQKYNVPFFDAGKLAKKLSLTGPLQPYNSSGMHLNLFGAANVVKESLKVLGNDTIEISSINFSDTPLITETDISINLYMLSAYKLKDEKYPNPVFNNKKQIFSTVAVLGDSNSFEYSYILNNSESAKEIITIFNKEISKTELEYIISNAQAVIFIINEIAINYHTNSQPLTSFYNYFRSENIDFYYVNWHDLEGDLRWSKDVSFLKVINKQNAPVNLSFDVTFPLSTVTGVDVYCEDTKIYSFNELGKINIALPDKCFINKKTTLKFVSHGAARPIDVGINKDARLLGFYMKNMQVYTAGL